MPTSEPDLQNLIARQNKKVMLLMPVDKEEIVQAIFHGRCSSDSFVQEFQKKVVVDRWTVVGLRFLACRPDPSHHWTA